MFFLCNIFKTNYAVTVGSLLDPHVPRFFTGLLANPVIIISSPLNQGVVAGIINFSHNPDEPLWGFLLKVDFSLNFRKSWSYFLINFPQHSRTIPSTLSPNANLSMDWPPLHERRTVRFFLFRPRFGQKKRPLLSHCWPAEPVPLTFSSKRENSHPKTEHTERTQTTRVAGKQRTERTLSREPPAMHPSWRCGEERASDELLNARARWTAKKLKGSRWARVCVCVSCWCELSKLVGRTRGGPGVCCCLFCFVAEGARP